MFLPPTNILLSPTTPYPPAAVQLDSNIRTTLTYSGNQASYSGNTTRFWNVDIEIWQVNYTYGGNTGAAWGVPSSTVVTDAQALIFMNYFVTVLTAMRAVRSDVVLGIFNELPTSDNTTGAQKTALDTRAGYLAPYVDYISPDLYVSVPSTPTSFRTYATRIIASARRYNKPVYVYLCPTMISGSLNYPLIDGVLWRAMLEICYELADGAIIWGGYDLSKPGYVQLPWNDTAPWWTATQAFIQAHTIQRVT